MERHEEMHELIEAAPHSPESAESRHELAGELEMRNSLQLGVKFVGYRAMIVALENGTTEVNYAFLDFVTGSVTLVARNAMAYASTLSELVPFVASLPRQARHLRNMQNQSTSRFTDVEFGGNKVSIETNANVTQAIRDLLKRCSIIEDVLRQAHYVGKQIQRRPYEEYVAEIAATGVCRVVSHGWGLFENGKLSFYAEWREALVRSVDANTMSVKPVTPPNPSVIGKC
jgi:hypothetical protein